MILFYTVNEERKLRLMEIIENKYPLVPEGCDKVMEIMNRWGFMSVPRLELHTGFDSERAKYSLIYLVLLGELRKGKDSVTYMLNRD